MNLEGQVALVTGATRGVGRGIAAELAQKGVRVFITGRSEPNPEGFDTRITVIRCDHGEDRAVEAAFDRIFRKAGSIDILISSRSKPRFGLRNLSSDEKARLP
jgi:NAD(P)-dependent dehydrogenase (short-subunit alcohol dehydrogenase family)